jgi:hypothetical protein
MYALDLFGMRISFEIWSILGCTVLLRSENQKREQECGNSEYQRDLRRRQNYLFGVLEVYLANGHTAVLLQVGPRRIDDCDVVFLIA